MSRCSARNERAFLRRHVDPLAGRIARLQSPAQVLQQYSKSRVIRVGCAKEESRLQNPEPHGFRTHASGTNAQAVAGPARDVAPIDGRVVRIHEERR